jgi:hypothetical protein
MMMMHLDHVNGKAEGQLTVVPDENKMFIGCCGDATCTQGGVALAGSAAAAAVTVCCA